MTRYVTTPIFYPNDVPHLGTVYPVVAADVAARVARSAGTDTHFLTGTDEHGKKIASAAQQHGATPKEFVDARAEEFRTAFAGVGSSHDRFIRTTDPDHEAVVADVLQRLYDRGDIYKGVYDGLYCVECEAYCKESDLLDGQVCPFHFKAVERLEEECYFFALSRYEDWLRELYEAQPDFIRPAGRRAEVLSFVGAGLEDLCISRTSFTWGIPLPFDPGHITYVWFDALLNYITGAGYGTDPERFAQLWPHATHIVGKDILRFHAVVWPALLQAAGIAPPRQVFAHGFWTVNGRKFSKSLGNVILPDYLVGRYGLDAFRYYLLRSGSFGEDSDFSEAALVHRNNTELAHGLGNLLRRTTALLGKYRGGLIPQGGAGAELEAELRSAAEATAIEVHGLFSELAFRPAFDAIWSLVGRLNAYANASAPWKRIKEGDDEGFDTSLAHLAEGLRFLAGLLQPVLLEGAPELARRLGLAAVPAPASLTWGNTLAGLETAGGPPLYPVLELDEVDFEAPSVLEVRASQEVVDLGISYAVVVVEGVEVHKRSSVASSAKRRTEARLRAGASVPGAGSWERLYRRIGKAPEEVVSAVAALAHHVLATPAGRLPRVNAVVDLYNAFSLETGLSIGAHDCAKIEGALRLEFAAEVRTFVPVGTSVPVSVQPGEYLWCDDRKVLCRLDVKQAEASAVTRTTRDVVFILQGTDAFTAGEVEDAARTLAERVVEACGGRVGRVSAGGARSSDSAA